MLKSKEVFYILAIVIFTAILRGVPNFARGLETPSERGFPQ